MTLHTDSKERNKLQCDEWQKVAWGLFRGSPGSRMGEAGRRRRQVRQRGQFREGSGATWTVRGGAAGTGGVAGVWPVGTWGLPGISSKLVRGSRRQVTAALRRV